MKTKEPNCFSMLAVSLFSGSDSIDFHSSFSWANFPLDLKLHGIVIGRDALFII